MQDYDFILYYIPEKTNTKANILLRKDQVDTVKDNKDVLLLKKEIWIRKTTIAEVKDIQRNQVVKETMLLKKIWKNNTKKQEVLKKLEKDEGQAWEDNGIVYVEERIYILNSQRIQEQIWWENHDPADVGYPG